MYASSLLDYHDKLQQSVDSVGTTTLQYSHYRTVREEPSRSLTVTNSSIKGGVFSLVTEYVGVAITPVLGILYVKDVDLLHARLEAAARNGTALQVEVVRKDVTVRPPQADRYEYTNLLLEPETFEISLFWSTQDSICHDKVS